MKRKSKVFLLDDEELIVSVLSKTLKKEGYEIYAETKTATGGTCVASCHVEKQYDRVKPGRLEIDVEEATKAKEAATEGTKKK
jgi:CheY-like chemotaxis protein